MYALHVAVLMGGNDKEREISLLSGENCALALENRGYHVTRVDVDPINIADTLSKLKPDVAFNILHGPYGEGGVIQGVLESLRIPYTHSGVAASSIAIRKDIFRRILASEGIPIAQGTTVNRFEAAKEHVLQPPYVIKPTNQGSSLGIFLVDSYEYNFQDTLLSDHWNYGDTVLIEQFIPGCDLTCGVIDNEALSVMQISSPTWSIFDYSAKYTPTKQQSRIIPAPLKPFVYQNVQTITERVHSLTGCRGLSRVDFRLNEDELVVLEINTQPGMSDTSMLPEMGRHTGWSLAEMVEWAVKDASCDR